MRTATWAVSVAAIVGFSLAPAYAQGRGGGHAHATPTHTTTPHTAATPTASTHTHTMPPQLATKLTPLLPKGMTIQQASAGFKNQGQFVAALHVSRNLDIPFTDLKSAMLGTSKTSTSPMSLGQAIHKLRPSADAGTEAARATTQANSDLKHE